MKPIYSLVMVVLSIHLAYSQHPLSLQASKELALKNNVTLKNSALETEAARQIKKNAYTSYFPKINAQVLGIQAIDPMVNYQMPGGNLPVYDGDPANLLTPTQFAYFPGASIQALQRTGIGVLSVTQPVYAGGRIHIGNQLAQLGVDIKENQERLTHDDILLKTEQQYWQLVSIQEKRKTIIHYEDLLTTVEKQVNDAYKSGLIIKNDILKVQLKKSELQANKSKLMSGHQLALRQFCQTLGIAYDSTLVVNETLGDLPLPQSVYTDHDAALLHRIAYQLLEQSVKASKLQTKLKEGEYLPQVAVGLVGYYANGLIKGGNSLSNGLVYGTVSVPVSDWWSGKYMVQEQRIREQMAGNTLTDTKALLKLQMDKAWVDVMESYRQIGLLEQTQMQARENVNVTQSSYRSGLVTVADLLEAQALLGETEDKLVEAKAHYRLAVSTYWQLTHSLP
ncbi:TolC family protein [Spirosoma sp. HMF3257]|uniref:TolC family protein n=1 Tax=Spirosoma telluris TaxID=2183553 RepID=A0A327NM50_9BACT|nr:TolC family protein [Spirosoma telluris]RAI75805.1 TolC family protein [Spirosoma telluris]